MHKEIIQNSLLEYSTAEAFLGLKTQNQNYEYLQTRLNSSISYNPQIGFGYSNLSLNNNFDIILAESFYIPFIHEFDKWVEVGIAVREGLAIYIDLEDQKLGRCYLISSEGYSLYHSRDIIARFVWAGIIEAEAMLTCADNRQNHSFNQVFAVIQKIIESGFYDDQNFTYFTKEQTEHAIKVLKKQSLAHIAFGFMTLPSGPMSTRKGKILAFDELKSELETKAKIALESRNIEISEQKIHKICLATLKWEDLKRDRETDIVFDIEKFMSFEGNTGVYQLYTYARLRSIINKNIPNPNLESENHDHWSQLNIVERTLIKQTFRLPSILDQIRITYRPHFLANHLFELATSINSWYSKYSVNSEPDSNRKQALLLMCNQLCKHFELCLDLLGIEVLEEL